jgi:hypothetical protein
MLINLHSQATTTPKVRAEIQASDEPAWVLAEQYGTTEQTVWKWRKRDSVNDRSHTAHRLQTTNNSSPPITNEVARIVSDSASLGAGRASGICSARTGMVQQRNRTNSNRGFSRTMRCMQRRVL